MQTDKPWGNERLIELNAAYMVKQLFMLAAHQCSLQYHEQKRETLFVVSGVLAVLVDGTPHRLIAGDTLTILPGQVHRMKAISDAVYLECSTPHPDDVVRLQDDYGRTV